MSRTLSKHERYWGDIAVYGDYLPWNVHKGNGGDRSNFPEHSGRILDLKNAADHAVEYFREKIEPGLLNGIVIVDVPSHDPAKPSLGLKKLVAVLSTRGNRVDGSACLIRRTKIDKLARGGDRSKDVHLKSVFVAQPEAIKGRIVLLIDDVTKTGNSLHACRELLLQAGAGIVECATIGKT